MPCMSAHPANIGVERAGWTRRLSVRDMSTITRYRSWTLIAMSVGLVVVYLSIWLSYVQTPNTLTLSGDGRAGTIESVAPGSREWLWGIRPGDGYLVSDDTPGVLVTATFVQDHWLTPPPAAALLGAALLLFAMMARPWAPGVASVALVASVVVATTEMLGLVAMPDLSLVLVSPALVASLLALDRRRTGSRLALVAFPLLAAMVVLILVSLATPEPPFVWLWDVSRFGPLAVAGVLAAGAVAGALFDIHRDRRAGIPLSVAITRSVAGGRRALRMTAEHEQERMIQRVHALVAPPANAALLAARVGDTARAERLFRQAADDLRSMMMSDQSLVLREAGLGQAIEDVIQRATEHGPTGYLDASATVERAPWEVELTALRVAQEAINNIVHHAAATMFIVRLDIGRHHLHMDVEDDGVGVRPQQSSDGGGLGLAAMRTRAREVGARVEVGAAQPTGTLVRYRWPT